MKLAQKFFQRPISDKRVPSRVRFFQLASLSRARVNFARERAASTLRASTRVKYLAWRVHPPPAAVVVVLRDGVECEMGLPDGTTAVGNCAMREKERGREGGREKERGGRG